MSENGKVRNLRQFVDSMRKDFPVGTRVRLISMGEDPKPVEAGSEGEVLSVDDIGSIHVRWDSGRVLALIYGVDSFEKIESEGGKIVTKAGNILSIIEEYLYEKGVEVPNEERDMAKKEDPFEEYAIIYGEDYYDLEDKIAEVLRG